MAWLRTLGTVLFGLAIAVPLAAQPITTQRADAVSTAGARGIAIADLNRDGWPDIATANNDPDGVSILTSRGTAGGYTSRFIPLPGGPFDIATGDFNRDSVPDLAIANPDAHEIDVIYGNAGTLGAPVRIDVLYDSRGLAVGDVDGDGNDDIVFTLYSNQGVQVLYGDGLQHFTVRGVPLPVGVNPQGVAIADFNMDGWNDLVVAASGSVGLTILYQTPGGGATFSRVDVANVPRSQNVVTVGDFNRDGRPDIAAAATGTSDVTIFINGKNFPSTLVYASGGGSTRGIAAVDLNRDGAVDIVTGNRGTSTIQILPGHGDGTFGAAYGFAAGAGARTVAVADLDNDGRIDIASGNEYAASATVLSNTTAFTKSAFAFSRTVLGGEGNGFGGGNSAAVGDFDLDGKLDVVTRGAGSGGAVVLLGNGAQTNLPTLAMGPNEITAASLNADGYPDVLLLDATAGDQLTRIEAYLGDGKGQFPGRKATVSALRALKMQAADMNRDGRVDVVLEGFNPANGATEIQVYAGRGDGTFAAGVALAGASVNGMLVLADVNRDGSIDITSASGYAYPRQGNAQIYTWLNDGAGRFPAAPRTVAVPEWDGLYGGAIGDVNHDGWPDLIATAFPTSADVHNQGMAFLAGGPSGFAAAHFIATGSYYTFPPHLADITLDGNLDILTEEGGILPGRGDGTFDAVSAFDYYAPGLQVVDFNKDGLPDVVATSADATAQIMLNQHRDTNLAPTVSLGPDWTMQYRNQFGDGENEFWAQGLDPDLHQLTFKWYDEAGTLLADTGAFPFFTLPLRNPGHYNFTVVASDNRGASARDTVAVTILPEKEVVIHTGLGYVWTRGDKWSIVDDSTAASGVTLHDRNDGAPKVTSPLASPASYGEVEFVADPTQTYKLWVRLKADGNGSGNDSAWLQFSGAVDANGKTYEPGTTSGIEVVLEECSGCGDAGWGWRDEAWGQRDMIGTVTLRFPTGGPHIVRLQTREDGVSVDQIVLSAEQYRTRRPGSVKNDVTILPPSIY